MTSQKRYRHHQEGNSANRFRDIPPRFKRQKSSTSPKPEDQENNVVEDQSTLVQSPPSTCAGAMAPSNNFANTLNPNNTNMHGQNRTDSHHVLSQMDNYYSGFPEQQWIPMNNGHYPNSTGYVSPPQYTWESPYVNPAVQQHRLYSPQLLMSRQETLSPSLQMAHVKTDESISGLQDCGFTNYSSPSVSPSPSVHQDGSRSTPDISDPDIRTIEMLRELERVADEKEKEDENDPTVDRKNLVSHHLRMLMCAVDRYTEGIEDDDTSTTKTDEPPVRQPPSEKTPSKKKSHHQSGKSTPPREQFSPRPNTRGTYSGKGRQDKPVPAQQAALSGQVSEDGDAWQVVNHSKRHSEGGGQHVNYHSRTPPPPSNLARTPPPQSSYVMIPHPIPSHSPYMQQDPRTGSAYPMRPITKYNNDFQSQPPQPLSPYSKQHSPVNTVSNACSPSFSPAPSPPLPRNIWGPPGMDSPTDTKSWDLWTCPSPGPEVFKQQAMNEQPANIPFAMYVGMDHVVPYAPVDLKEQLPLYRR